MCRTVTFFVAANTVVERHSALLFFQELEDARLSTAGATTSLETGTYTFSGSGDVQDAPTFDVYFTDPSAPDKSSTSGCEAEDFDGLEEGDVALILRGAPAPSGSRRPTPRRPAPPRSSSTTRARRAGRS